MRRFSLLSGKSLLWHASFISAFHSNCHFIFIVCNSICALILLLFYLLIAFHKFRREGSQRHISEGRRTHHTHIVVNFSNTVVISVTHVDNNVLALLIEERSNTTWLIEGCTECLPINESILVVRTAEPRENLIAERINYLNFVIVSICHQDYILFRDKGQA